MSDKLNQFSKNDRVLFNDRKLPLTVEAVDDNRIHLKGPQGGEYIIFPAENDPELLLVANKGSREYASKVENLREIGEWRKTGETQWQHTKTGRKIELVKNEAGFWTIDTELEVDVPKYGYSTKEAVLEEIEELMKKNPEG